VTRCPLHGQNFDPMYCQGCEAAVRELERRAAAKEQRS
jgi:hypothetical protein